MAFEYTPTSSTIALWDMSGYTNQLPGLCLLDRSGNGNHLYQPAQYYQEEVGLFNKAQKTIGTNYELRLKYLGDYLLKDKGFLLNKPTTISTWIKLSDAVFNFNASYSIMEGYRYYRTSPIYIVGRTGTYPSTNIDISIHITDSNISLYTELVVFAENYLTIYQGIIHTKVCYNRDLDRDIYHNIIVTNDRSVMKLYFDGEFIEQVNTRWYGEYYDINPILDEFYIGNSISQYNSQRYLALSETVIDSEIWTDSFIKSYGSQRSNKYNFTISPGI